MQNVIEILRRIGLNMYIAFGSMAIFTVLILPVHKHGRPSNLLMSSSFSLFNGLQLSFEKVFGFLL
jgi:hypothetical protein